MINLEGSRDDYLPLIEFSYNNGYDSIIGMTAFEALYGRRCMLPVWWFEIRESSVYSPKIIHEAIRR